MGAKTGIEWTDATWNPVRGCSRVSPGCEHCYAERMATRFSGRGEPYEGLINLRTPKNGSAPTHGETGKVRTGVRGVWNGKVRLVPEHLADPLRWKRPRRIFVNSMSDLFHENLADEDIAAVFGVMAAAHRHTFQVLTKRAERMRDFVRWLSQPRPLWVPAHLAFLEPLLADAPETTWPLPNVWLGVSVEDQQRADERIPPLLETPAAVRFISAEPLLGPVVLQGRHADENVTRIRSFLSSTRCYPSGQAYKPPTLDWVIAGAESGPGARPAELDWYRAVRDQCERAGVAFFLKQHAERGRKLHLPVLDGRRHVAFPRSCA